jgi:site-specific DNA recombinase
MITAFSEQLITIDELRAGMPDLRARQTGLTATTEDRQRVLQVLVQDILIGPDK